MRRGPRQWLVRFAAPAAFLLAVTVAVLIVQSALRSDDPVARRTTPRATAPARTGPARPVRTTPTTTAATTRPRAPAEFYAIKDGDTLATVANLYDTSVAKLLELNPGVDPVALTIGQRVRVK